MSASQNAESEIFLTTVVTALVDPLTLELRRKARSAGWPLKLVNSLTVVAEKGAIFVDYPEEYRQEIEDTEYGTTSKPPVSVIRPFIYTASSEVAWALKQRVAEDIFENGGIWGG